MLIIVSCVIGVVKKLRFKSANRLRNLILLFILAILAPAVMGFQYLEWRDSNHLFIGVMGSIWAISYSDWYLNDWLFILIPNVIVLIPRVLFVFALVGFDQDRVDLKFVHFFGLLLIGIEVIICLVMMPGNSILGVPPGVLYSIPAPDVDIRLFVPTPIVLLVGMYQVRKIEYSRRMKEGE